MAKGKYEEWLSEAGLLKIGAWARDGLSNEQIAHNMGISRKTLQEWANRYGDIRDKLKKEKAVADIKVENALHKRAVGYNQKVLRHVKVKKIKYDENTGRKVRESEELVAVEDEVHIPADVTAQIFWLKHRKPEVWNEPKQENCEEKGIIVLPECDIKEQ